MTTIHIDFETRSAVDLKRSSTHAYALDPSTDAWCMAYCFDEEHVQLWKMGEPFPTDLRLALNSGKVEFVAHNAPFELTIWNHLMHPRHGWPLLPPERTYCTMAMAYAMALPASLENAGAALGLDVAKDMDGRRLMLQMAQPRGVNKDGSLIWWDDEQRKERLYAYCKNDVIVERELEKRMHPLSDDERKVWLLDHAINERGVMVDLPTIDLAMTTIATEKVRLDEAIQKASGDYIKGASDITGLKEFVRFHGIPIESLGKAEVKKTLQQTGLPPAVREALLIRQEGAKSSTAKLKAMADAVSPDHRVRGILQYHGAGTGRWAGRKIQPQNFPRGELLPSEINDAIKYLGKPQMLSILYGNPLQVISDCLRAMIIAKPGHDLIAADFSSIEARVLAWLADQQSTLDIFTLNEDIYVHAAAKIFNIQTTEVTKAQRQVGKTAVLALGYQGGVGAFQTMAKSFGIDMSAAYVSLLQSATATEKAKAEKAWELYNAKTHDEPIPYEIFIASDLTKQAWREANSEVVAYWRDLNNAAKSATLDPTKVFTAGPASHPHRQVRFKKSGSFLWCRLPSGRKLCYPYPQIKEITPPWETEEDEKKKTYPALVYKGVDSKTRTWQTQVAYGGLLAENITQAVARDFLVTAMFNAEEKGYKVIFHVHDELVAEVPEDFGSVEELETLITVQPEWGKDCPISAEGWRGKRYRK